MGFLGFGKNDKVIDLGERYRSTDKAEKEDVSNFSPGPSGSSEDSEFSGSPEENRKKLAKRLLDITKKLDEISTQIYHIQQRVELLERKTGIRNP